MSAVATITALALVLIGSAPTTGLITWSGRATCGMPCHRKLSTSILTYASKVDDMNVATTEVDVSKGQSEGTVGGISLTYLEINSWMWEVNGLRVLVDPLFGTLDFGIPALFRGEKKVIRDHDAKMKEFASITDHLLISQGLDDHCHPPTIEVISKLLDPSVRIVAPPSASAVLEKHFLPERISYLLPGQSTTLKSRGRAVEVLATTGAKLGPPWQQEENGFILCPAAANTGEKAPPGGSLYYEPHLMFSEEELSRLHADVVIAPVVSQIISTYTLVAGGSKAVRLAELLGAKTVVSMPNANIDASGPLSRVITEIGSEAEFRTMAEEAGFNPVAPVVGQRMEIWP